MAMNPHGMDPVRVLHLAASMGTIAAHILIVGCEPHDFGDELDGRMGLSPTVQGAVEAASDMVEELVGRIASTKSLRIRSEDHGRGDVMTRLALGVLGLIAIGLAISIAPDIQRYIKISSM